MDYGLYYIDIDFSIHGILCAYNFHVNDIHEYQLIGIIPIIPFLIRNLSI